MPSPVQSVSGSATSGTTVTVPLTATGAGHSLVVYVGASQDTTNPTVSKVTVNGATNADNFAQCCSNVNNAECNSYIWYDPNCASGITSVEVTFAAGTGTEQCNAVWVEEWPVVLALDTHPAGAGNSSGVTSFASNSTGTLASANEIVGGTVMAEGTSSQPTITGPGSGWTNHAQISLQSIAGMIAGWNSVSATTALTYSGTMSKSSVYGACIASFTYTSGPGVAGTVQPQATVPVPRRRPVRALWRAITGQAYVQVPAPPQQPGPAPRRKPGRAVVRFTPVTTVNAVPPPPAAGTVQPAATVPVPRRRPVRALWRGITGQAYIQVPAPRQQYRTPPRRKPARAIWRGITGTTAVPRQLLISIAAQGGVDDYGNEYTQGVNTYSNGLISKLTDAELVLTWVAGAEGLGGPGPTADGGINAEAPATASDSPGLLIAGPSARAGAPTIPFILIQGESEDGSSLPSVTFANSDGSPLPLNLGLATPAGYPLAGAPPSYSDVYEANQTTLINSIVQILSDAGFWPS